MVAHSFIFCHVFVVFFDSPKLALERFFCEFQQKSCINHNYFVPLHREPAPRDVCTSLAEGSRHIENAFIALCSDKQKSRKFRKKNQDLATIDVQRDIDYPSCAYLGSLFVLYMHAHTRTINDCKQHESIFYIRRGLRVVGSILLGNARASICGTDSSRNPRFFCMPTIIHE